MAPAAGPEAAAAAAAASPLGPPATPARGAQAAFAAAAAALLAAAPPRDVLALAAVVAVVALAAVGALAALGLGPAADKARAGTAGPHGTQKDARAGVDPAAVLRAGVEAAQHKMALVKRVIPHVPTLVPHIGTLAPYSLEMMGEIDRLAPMLESIMAEKEHLLPLLPDLLRHRKVLLEHMDVFAPHVHELAPHTATLLRHIDTMMPHMDAMRPHVGDLVVFLSVRGWEDSLVYMDQVLPHIAALAPHTKRLCLYYDTLLPHLPMLVKYIEYMDVAATLDVLDRLIPLISFLPLADQSGILYSRLVCKSIPTVARILPLHGPPMVSTDLDPSPTPRFSAEKVLVRRHFVRGANAVCGVMSPLPGRFRAHTMRFRVPDAFTDARGIVRYQIVIDFSHAQSLRYRDLRGWHKRIAREISNYCSMRLLPFPEKTFMGRRLSAHGISCRRMALENYFERLADNSHVLIEESPSFRAFVRTFYNADEVNEEGAYSTDDERAAWRWQKDGPVSLLAK